MDNGDGTFVEVKKEIGVEAVEGHTESKKFFSVGDHLVIRGSHFRIKSVKPRELRLKLLPKNK